MSNIANGGATGGSATVNSGTANQIAYYATTGTAVSGDTKLTDDGSTLDYAGVVGLNFSGGTGTISDSANGQGIIVQGNTASTSGVNGGGVTLQGGDGGGGNSSGGNVSLLAGSPTGTGAGGANQIIIRSGGPASGGGSGQISLQVGAGNSGVSGNISLKVPGTSGQVILGATETTANRKATLAMTVNAGGTFSLTPSVTTGTWTLTPPTSGGIATQQLYTDGTGVTRWGAATTVDLTAQSAAISATTLYAVPAASGGTYRICWSATITTAASTSSVLGGSAGFQIVYTSPTDSVVKTTVTGNSITSTANTTGTAVGGVEVVYAKASTNIQYQYDYTSVGVTPMQFELHIKCEAL